MTRLFLKLLSGPLMFLLACVLLAFQSSFFLAFPLNWIQPDFLLLLVIWFTLKRDFTEGGVMTLLIGHLAEMHSSSPSGTLLVAYMSVFLGVQFASRFVVIPDFQSWIRLTLFSSLGWRMASLAVLAYLDKAEIQWKHTLFHLLPGAVATGMAGLWLFPLLDRLDKLTHRNLRQEQQLSDDLRLQENEGI